MANILKSRILEQSTKHSIKSLSLFFPAYNDEHNIEKVVDQALSVIDDLGITQYEIILIEDGSPDNTDTIVDNLASKHDHVKAIHHTKNLGYGKTLKEGFLSAKHDWIFYSDGDNQFLISELSKLIVHAKKKTIVIGHRDKKQYQPLRKINSYYYNLLITKLFKLQIKDVNCAFKLIPKELIDSISITSKQGFIDGEIIIKALSLGYDIVEIEVTHLPRKNGEASGGRINVIVETFIETLRYWIKRD